MDPFILEMYDDLLYRSVRVLGTRVIPVKEANNDSLFHSMWYAELSGLLYTSIFEFVPRRETEGHCIYALRFVVEIQDFGTPRVSAKSWFVLCGHRDVNHGLITHAPTVQHSSCRLLLNSQQDSSEVASCDIILAFAQTFTMLQRPVYAKETALLHFGTEIILRFIYALYGLVEFGVHWLLRYHGHHHTQLHLKPADYDLCLQYSPLYFGEVHISPPPDTRSQQAQVKFNRETLALPNVIP